MGTRTGFRSRLAIGLVILGLLSGGLTVAPVAATAPAVAGRALVTVSAPNLVAATVGKPRATLTAVQQPLPTGQVKVSVITNAKKVKLAYRTAKGNKRTATMRIRAGAGVKVLGRGSKRIKAQALATSRLRESRWVTVRVAPVPVVVPAPAVPLVPPVLSPVPSPVMPSPAPLQFDLIGALAIGLTSNRSLVRVDADGSIRSALASGAVSIWDFFVGPDGAVYLQFNGPVDPRTGQLTGGLAGSCWFGRIVAGSGVVECLDAGTVPGAMSFQTTSDGNLGYQFDASGALYVLGWQGVSGVIRRYANGTVTDVASVPTSLTDFLVLPNGEVLMTNRNPDSVNSTVRRILPSGQIVELVTNRQVTFARLFPDGNAYLGILGTNMATEPSSVRRYLPASAAFDPKVWIARDIGWGLPDTYHDITALCHPILSEPPASDPFCDSAGARIGGSAEVAGASFMWSAGFGRGYITRYYPNVPTTEPRATTQVVTLKRMVAAGSRIALAGLDQDARHILTAFDTATGSESVLLGPDNQVEVYRMGRVAHSSSVVFDGLRFSDGKIIVGIADLASGVVTMVSTGQASFAAFAAL